MFKTNDSLNPIVNSQITEYDIKSGNTSIMKYFNLAPLDLIKKIESMKKKDRNIFVGNMMKKDKTFSKELEKGFDNIVKLFIEKNNLDISNIVSIKRDAIFVKDKIINNVDFSDCIHFVKKNSYDGFIKLGQYEFWINRDNCVDVKGISDELLIYHSDGVIQLIMYVYNVVLTNFMNKEKINSEMQKIVTSYRKKEFDFNMYREFNSESKFKIRMNSTNLFYMDNINEILLDKCDISYNYEKIIIPLIRMFC